MIGLLISSNLVMVVTYLVKMRSIPPQIPLLYSLPIGEDQLVEWWMIFTIPFLVNALYIINTVVLNKFFPQEQFVRSLIKYANTTIIIIGTYIFLRVLFLVS